MMKRLILSIFSIFLILGILSTGMTAFAGSWDTDPVCIDHVFVRELVVPATATEDGFTAMRCKTCKELREDPDIIIIPRIASVTLSCTQYDYTGKAHTPKVTAKDRNGNIISADNYEVKYVNNRVVGKKTYANIVFKGFYNAAYNRYFTISLAKPKVSVKAGTNTVALSWQKVIGATYYRVYEYNAAKNAYTRLVSTKNLSYTVANVAAGTAKQYLVRAYFINAAKKEVLSPFTTADNVGAVTLCKAPVVKAAVSGTAVTLQYAKCTGAKFYRVYAYNAATKKYTTLVSSTAATSVKLTKQVKGTHYYLVRAFNSANAGSAYSTKNHVKAIVK